MISLPCVSKPSVFTVIWPHLIPPPLRLCWALPSLWVCLGPWSHWLRLSPPMNSWFHLIGIGLQDLRWNSVSVFPTLLQEHLTPPWILCSGFLFSL